MDLAWMTCADGTWCSFEKVDLSASCFDGLEGVYVIWYNGHPGRTIWVGQGLVRERLEVHRQEPGITRYSDRGLLVSWASVYRPFRDGVERFLGETLNPLVGARFPDSAPIEVNLPW